MADIKIPEHKTVMKPTPTKMKPHIPAKIVDPIPKSKHKLERQKAQAGAMRYRSK